MEAARNAPVALYASEEIDAPAQLAADAPLVLAVDPLDGSSNIDANVAIGTIFSVLPAERPRATKATPAFPLPGARQLAAGYVVYGPRTELVLTVGCGTHAFTLDPRTRGFHLTRTALSVAPHAAEFAINVSNYRHWEETVRTYVDDCLKGADGRRGKDFNMRWIASLVAEAHRILGRGGVFLYPADARQGYAAGRLRLVYEANPIAFLIEQAGGAATDGEWRILDLEPRDTHQRTPLVFGARDEVASLQNMLRHDHALGDRSPLFGSRGLFRT
jgi:fructose-1,6-bisphosphatase I